MRNIVASSADFCMRLTHDDNAKKEVVGGKYVHIDENEEIRSFVLCRQWRDPKRMMIIQHQKGLKEKEASGSFSVLCQDINKVFGPDARAVINLNDAVVKIGAQGLKWFDWNKENTKRQVNLKKNADLQEIDEDRLAKITYLLNIVETSKDAYEEIQPKNERMYKAEGYREWTCIGPHKGGVCNKVNKYPMNKNRTKLQCKRCGMFLANCHEEAIRRVIHKHPNYVLTFDNILKMIAIYFRVKSDIPVLLRGESGVGKTKLIAFLSDLINVRLYKFDVHGGYDDELIQLKMRDPVEYATIHPHKKVWIFWDEINTSAWLDLFKEMVCDKSIFGDLLPPNIDVLAALNPWRKRKNRNPNAPEEIDELVYRVYKIPPTFSEYVWDFGRLSPDDELEYTGQILGRALHNACQKFGTDDDKNIDDIESSLRKTWTDAVIKAQYLVREYAGNEVSACSLRDVARCAKLFRWFLDNRPARCQMKPGTSSPTDFVHINEKQYHWAVTKAIGMCYWYRLSGKKEKKYEGRSQRDHFATELDACLTKSPNDKGYAVNSTHDPA